LGYIGFDEPFKRLVNQGMIQGSSRFVYRIKGTNEFVSFGLKENYETDELHVDVNFVDGIELDTTAFSNWKPDYANASFILEEGKYLCGVEVEKMSKSKFNTVNPDDLVLKYGADTFRMYEMFLGPIEQSKPWDTKGITGVHGFLKKYWRLFHQTGQFAVSEGEASKEAMKTLHKTIKRLRDDLDRFSFNTGVSSFMICVNELTDQKCNNREVLTQLSILMAPYAPHITEEIWSKLQADNSSIFDQAYPVFNEQYLKESDFEYPVSFNGKMRFKVSLSVELSSKEIEDHILGLPETQKYLEGKTPKKIIIVPGRIVNFVS
jgi:leucyl-tRNA synthetase